MSFQFKQFTIQQDKTAMKVGTDGVLLGAWTSLESNPNSILDIGTGTGLIALQLAQRSDSEIIDAIEIENNAFEQAVANFEQSKWNNRLYCYHASLKQFTQELEEKYDLIVSNPPFYNEHSVSDNNARNKARSTSSLSFEELIKSVSKLLNANGVFSVIIPYKEEMNFSSIAKKNHLFPTRICHIKGTNDSLIKRSLMEFEFTEKSFEISELTIEIERHFYTKKYTNLVKDFYLKM